MKREMPLLVVALAAVILLGAVAALVASLQERGTPADISYITVTASGVAYAFPQNATVYVTMNGSGSNAEAATANLSATLARFNSTALGYLGGNQSRITTQSYSLVKAYNSSRYEAAETVSMELPSVRNVSALLGSLALIPHLYVYG